MKQLRRVRTWSLTIVAAAALALLISTSAKVSAAGEFITTWKTDVNDPTDASVLVPTYSGEAYNYSIDWGDGNTDTNVTGDAAHTYASPGTYTVKISGTFPRVYFSNYSDAPKLQSIDSWGSMVWTSMADAFKGASNAVIHAGDAPDLSSVTSLNSMFSGASSLNHAIGHWDVSNVDNFSYMFEGASSFDQDLSSWDLSAAQSFLGMFYGASSFNQNVNNWNVSLNTTINSMFRGASSFNQPLNNWDVSGVLDTRFAFQGASSFNQDLSSWRLPLVEKMEYMFQHASNFDQNVGDWNVSSLQRADYMFQGSALSPVNYDALLAGWRQDNPNNDIVFFGMDTTYCNGSDDRTYLIDTLGWHITDGGFDGSTCGPTDIFLVGINDPTVQENQDGGPIGTLASVDVDNDATHTYTLTCQVDYPDAAYFAINGNELSSTTAFDFDAPLDADGNNVYQICVTSIDKNGYSIEKEFLISILEDQQEIVIDDGEVLGVNTPEENGFPASSSNSNGQVLSSHDGETLASTGVSIAGYLAAGLFVVGLAYYLTRTTRGRIVYKLLRQTYDLTFATSQPRLSMVDNYTDSAEAKPSKTHKKSRYRIRTKTYTEL